MLSGRFINRWWRKLPQIEKARFIDRIRQRRTAIAGVASLIAASGVAFYHWHVELCPYTGRRRLMLISSGDLNAILTQSSVQEVYAGSPVLSPGHPYYKSVQAIIDTLIHKNRTLYGRLSSDWRLTICDNNSIINAACLPTGEIIVFTGLISFVENQHQLAAVLAHELSHVILEHGRETISRSVVVNIYASILAFILWTVVPGDIVALFSNWLKNRMTKIFLELPHSRMMESEADVLGLELMARACFNVEESKRFWEVMDVFEKKTGNFYPNWLSTHPISVLRAYQIADLIPSANQISKDNGCAPESWWALHMKKYRCLLLK